MHGRVVETRWLTPHLVRVVLGGEGLVGLPASEFTDAYVNLAFPPSGATYVAPFDIDDVRARLPRDQWPLRRRYTIRAWDPEARLLTLDFVVHGDEGIAGPWAAAARPGDVLQFTGPGGDHRPDPEADWHLMVGDESALPAIAACLEAIGPGVPVIARLLVEGPDDELALDTQGDLDVAWLHRSEVGTDPDVLVSALQDLTFPEGRVHAFVHGEAGEVREVRRHLLAERDVPRAHLSASGYWRRHLTDEGWRAIKRDWQAEVEQDV